MSIFNPMAGKKYLIPVVVFLICLGAFLIRWYAGARIIDDSYITYRYVRNILAGNGFVYNPGEHILGTTTPFYTLILAALASLFGGAEANIPQISITLNAIIDGFNCLGLYLIGRKMSSSRIGIAAALAWAFAPYSVTFAIGGLETSVYVFCLLYTAVLYLGENYAWSALLAAFAFLTRPDALILIVPLSIDFLFSHFKPLIQFHQDSKRITISGNRNDFKNILVPMLVILIPVSAWLIFATIYFGSPIPHSITAKTIAYRLPEDTALIRFLQHYATPFFENLSFGSLAIAMGLFLYPSLALFGFYKVIKKQPRAFPLMLYPWLYFLTFSLANPLIFRWYLTPPLWIYLLSIFIGLESVIDLLTRNLARFGNNQSSIKFTFTFLALYLVPTLLVAQAWSLHPDHGSNKPAPQMAWVKLELIYQEAAEIIKGDCSSPQNNIVIAAGDVGVLGYFTSAKILDTVGLNSPQTISYYPLAEEYYVINYAIPPRLITDYQPDYVVFLEVYGRKGLLTDSQFLSDYHPIALLDTDIYGSQGMLIYKRNE